MDSTFAIDIKSGLRIPRPSTAYKGININTAGFRGPEIASPKPVGTVRLAFLGASTTFCAEVSNDATTWPDMVTRNLNERFSQTTFDYMNAGWIVDHSRLAYLVYMNAAIWNLRTQDRDGSRRRLELGEEELTMLRAGYRDRIISLIRAAQRSVRLVAVATFSHRVRHDNVPPAGSNASIPNAAALTSDAHIGT